MEMELLGSMTRTVINRLAYDFAMKNHYEYYRQTLMRFAIKHAMDGTMVTETDLRTFAERMFEKPF